MIVRASTSSYTGTRLLSWLTADDHIASSIAKAHVTLETGGQHADDQPDPAAMQTDWFYDDSAY